MKVPTEVGEFLEQDLGKTNFFHSENEEFPTIKSLLKRISDCRKQGYEALITGLGHPIKDRFHDLLWKKGFRTKFEGYGDMKWDEIYFTDEIYKKQEEIDLQNFIKSLIPFVQQGII